MLIEIEVESVNRVCDAALRQAGINAVLDVNKLLMAVARAQQSAISKSEMEVKDGSTISSDNSKLAE